MRVLMIEDNENDYLLIARQIAKAGSFHIERRASLEEGLAYLDTAQADVVLLDMHLPGISGLPIFDRLKSRFPRLPVVIVSGSTTDAEAIEAVRRGAQDYLSKGDVNSYILGKALIYAVERKRSEEALRQSEERYRAIFEQAAVGIVHVDEHGRWLRFNQKFCDILGYSRDEIQTLSWQELTYSDDIQSEGNGSQKLISGEIDSYSLEKRYIRKDGSISWANITVSMVSDTLGEKPYFSVIVEDITRRKQIEAAFIEGRNLLQILMDNIPDEIFFKDHDLRFVRVNRFHANMMGFESAEDAIGKSDFDVHLREVAEQTRVDELHILETGERIVDKIEFNPTLDGEPRWFSVTKVPRYDPSGRIVGIIGIARNITERKQIENMMQAQEEFLRQIIDNNPNLIFVKDWDGRFLLVNHAFADFNGMTVEQAIGKTDSDLFVTNEQREEFRRDDREVMTSRQTKFIPQEAVISAKGQLHWFQTIKVPLIGIDGKINRVLGVAAEITQRKQAEEALAAERNLLRTLIDNNPNLIFVKDWDGRFLLVNRAFADFNGMTVEQVIGKTERDLWVTNKRVEAFLRDDREVMTSRQTKFIPQGAVITSARGQMHWFQTIKVPLIGVDGKSNRVLGVATDITHRKQAEDALAAERNLLRTLMDNIPDLIDIKDTGSRFVIANPPVLGLLGLKKMDDLIGRMDADFLPPGQAQRWYETEQRLMQSGQPLVNYEEDVVDQSTGNHRSFLITKMPLKDEQGKIIGIISINRDITERRQAEAQRLDLQLEREKIDLTRQFLSEVSHDFRTPLAIMKTSVYLVKKSPDPERRAHHLDKLDHQINHIEKLLEDIFTLSRLDLKVAQFDFKKCNLNSILKSLHTYYEPLALQNSSEMRLSLDPAMPIVQSDEYELNTALEQIISNAISYTPSGGIIRLETHHDDQTVSIEIHDTGIGISSDDVPHIFERFFRADRARGIDTGGSGLGLSIAHKIVEELHGRIEIESVVGKGSLFRVRLPRLIPA